MKLGLTCYTSVILLSINSCHIRYKVTKNYIKSSDRINEFQFRVVTPNTQPFPPPYAWVEKYVITDTLINCFHSSSDSNYSRRKKIFFKTPNKGYHWAIDKKIYDTLPISFLPKHWYLMMLSAHKEERGLFYYILIYVDREGRIEPLYRYTPGPF